MNLQGPDLRAEIAAAPPLPSVRLRLRAATDDIHQALHRAAPFAAIADGRATLAGYGKTLSLLYRYHAGMQAACKAGARVLGVKSLALSQAWRISALARDLSHLSLSLPPVVNEPAGEGAFCAGMLYTVLGSTLGGKVIFRQLDALLPDTLGRSFFQGTPEDGRNWQSLCAALESHDDIAALEAGARHAFQRFADLLDT